MYVNILHCICSLKASSARLTDPRDFDVGRKRDGGAAEVRQGNVATPPFTSLHCEMQAFERLRLGMSLTPVATA